ncbi:MAG: hypothetical protein IT521_02025 [Burkholderiales bacterium]|nr:hypothetical protein [Burkholderiales bacterium]
MGDPVELPAQASETGAEGEVADQLKGIVSMAKNPRWLRAGEKANRRSEFDIDLARSLNRTFFNQGVSVAEAADALLSSAAVILNREFSEMSDARFKRKREDLVLHFEQRLFQHRQLRKNHDRATKRRAAISLVREGKPKTK